MLLLSLMIPSSLLLGADGQVTTRKDDLSDPGENGSNADHMIADHLSSILIGKTVTPPSNRTFIPLYSPFWANMFPEPATLSIISQSGTPGWINLQWLTAATTSSAAKFPMRATGKLSKGKGEPVWRLALSTPKVDLLLGADDKDDVSLHDDWVGEKSKTNGHKIQNFVKIDSSPNTTFNITLESKVDGTGSITIAPETLTITTDAHGIGVEKFIITGGKLSSKTENIQVIAKMNNTEVGSETLTVLSTQFFEVNDGKDPIPWDPININSFEHKNDGNLFGCHHGSTSDFAKFSLPDTKNSSKISPSKIEVLWAREIWKKLLDSIDDKGLKIAPAKTDLMPEVKTNFRMRDTSFLKGSDNKKTVNYYFGHPTTHVGKTLAINSNYVDKTTAYSVKHWKFPVHVHILSSPTYSAGVISAQITTMFKDVSTLWSQAGIDFNIKISTHTVTDDLMWVRSSNHRIVNKVDDVTATNQDSKRIDVYFVDSLIADDDSELNGVTVIPSYFDWTRGKPDVLIAVNSVALSKNPIIKMRQLIRVIAHELGHYLLDEGDSAHSTTAANLLNDANFERRRNLIKSQSDQIRASGIPPKKTD